MASSGRSRAYRSLVLVLLPGKARLEIQEFQANLPGCLEEVQRGTTLLLTDSEHEVAPIAPEPNPSESTEDVLIVPGTGRL